MRTLRKKTEGFKKVAFKGSYDKSREIRSSYKWTKISKIQRHEFPLCMSLEHCKKPIIATQVHHIVSLKKDRSKAYDEYNCVPLCQHCHEEVERKEAMGIDTSKYFKEWWLRRKE